MRRLLLLPQALLRAFVAIVAFLPLLTSCGVPGPLYLPKVPPALPQPATAKPELPTTPVLPAETQTQK